MLTVVSKKTVPDLRDQGLLFIDKKGIVFIMAQKDNLQPLHVEISNSEVSANLKVCVTIDLRLINQKYPRKYLKAEDIARELNSRTGEDYWSERKVNKKLAELGYQIKPYQAWQPTEKGRQIADFSNPVPKWSPQVVDLILQQLPQQLRLAV
jgi:hypothetical protein